MTPATAVAGQIQKVAMGGLETAAAPDVLETLLGSCVGIAVWDGIAQVGGLAHVMLPDSAGDTKLPGKYANTAVAELKRRLVAQGARPGGLTAKIAGGATMFGTRTTADVGQRNCDAVTRELARHNIKLLAEHIGGDKGRVIHFAPADGSVVVFVGRKQVGVI